MNNDFSTFNEQLEQEQLERSQQEHQRRTGRQAKRPAYVKKKGPVRRGMKQRRARRMQW